jgi:hypothetical protein
LCNCAWSRRVAVYRPKLPRTSSTKGWMEANVNCCPSLRSWIRSCCCCGGDSWLIDYQLPLSATGKMDHWGKLSVGWDVFCIPFNSAVRECSSIVAMSCIALSGTWSVVVQRRSYSATVNRAAAEPIQGHSDVPSVSNRSTGAPTCGQRKCCETGS